MGDDPTDRELLWRQYNLWLDLYKFHMDLILKANAFFYLITGGILSYYFAHPEQQLIRWALLLPAFISLALTAAFAYGARLVNAKGTDLSTLANQLNFQTAPNEGVLRVLLWAGSGIFLLVAVSLVILMVFRP